MSEQEAFTCTCGVVVHDEGDSCAECVTASFEAWRADMAYRKLREEEQEARDHAGYIARKMRQEDRS